MGSYMYDTLVPRYSVVVPAYNEQDLIGDCVRAVANQTVSRSDYEIIVVDDASTDSTSDVARAAGADIVLRARHGGAAAARNAGLQVAHGDIVLFTDADCAPSPDWIARMVAPFSDPKVVGAKGTYRTRQQGLIPRLVQLEFEIRYERMAKLTHIDFVDTYAAAYRRSVLLAEGGFSTDYPVPSAEDVDLSFRLARAGHLLVFVPDAWVEHIHPESLFVYLRRKMRFGYWRALLYLRYPDKIAGDAHTDPALKMQFGLAALAVVFGVGSVLWWPSGVAAVAMLVAFAATTLPFVRWVWPRDHAVAAIWPLAAFSRALVQIVGLALGLAVHSWKPLGGRQ